MTSYIIEVNFYKFMIILSDKISIEHLPQMIYDCKNTSAQSVLEDETT